MDDILHIETIGELNKIMGQEEPKHPLIGIIDFSKMDFSAHRSIKISTGFYTVMQKNLCSAALETYMRLTTMVSNPDIADGPKSVLMNQMNEIEQEYCFK